MLKEFHHSHILFIEEEMDQLNMLRKLENSQNSQNMVAVGKRKQLELTMQQEIISMNGLLKSY